MKSKSSVDPKLISSLEGSKRDTSRARKWVQAGIKTGRFTSSTTQARRIPDPQGSSRDRSRA